VSLVDQFGSSTDAVKKPKFLCAPTNKLDEDPTAPTHPDHLTVYQIKNTVNPSFPTNITVIDQFTPERHLGRCEEASMSFPSDREAPERDATDARRVHDRSFRVLQERGHIRYAEFIPVIGVTLADQFGSMTVTVKKPKFLCNPVDKNGEDPMAPTHPVHLLCYQIKQTDVVKFAKRTGLFINNQFGPETLDAKKPALLCVPATMP